jgi:hypothetical protein
VGSYGIEAIRHFGNARANGVSTAGDSRYTFNRSNGFDRELASAGHQQRFYWAEQDCWEDDIQDFAQGGDDRAAFDNADICWIETHGNHTPDGQARLLYDIPKDQWRTFSGTWRLGDQDADWLMAYSCDTAPHDKVLGLWNLFNGLHMFCGAWGKMFDGDTTDECGEDVGDNLTSGDTVAESWIDGVSDWSVDNHPIVVCAADAATWNNGNVRWDLSAIDRDHLFGHGGVTPDLFGAQKVALLATWADG